MQESNLEFSSDKSRMDVDLIHTFLNGTYWAQGRPLELVKRSIETCRCYGVFVDGNQIAFARVVTDRIVFAYLMDVFVLPEFRRRGIATQLLEHMLADPELADVSVWHLKTQDAHPLYRSVGFKDMHDPENFMALVRNKNE